MSDSWLPEPDPFGSLEPPRRNPPTAVGVATPPPPGRPTYFDPRGMRRRRLASAFVGTALTASATLLAAAGTVWTMIAGAGLGGVGGMLLYRSIRPATTGRGLPSFSLADIGRRIVRSRRRAA